MKRTFPVLAMIDALALLTTFAIGLVKGFSPTLHDQLGALLHFEFGLFTVIGNLGLHCLVFIYFLGTGRWVKEVALAYPIPDDPLPKLTRDLKRRVFPPALFAMLVPIATAASGMGSLMQEWPWPIHLGLAVFALAINAWAYTVEYQCISQNAWVLHEVLREVDRIRAERGLPSNAEQLQQEERL